MVAQKAVFINVRRYFAGASERIDCKSSCTYPAKHPDIFRSQLRV